MRTWMYAVIVVCYVLGGIRDCVDGDVRIGIVALLYAAATAALFVWRA